jgi:hypothetical protein
MILNITFKQFVLQIADVMVVQSYTYIIFSITKDYKVLYNKKEKCIWQLLLLELIMGMDM